MATAQSTFKSFTSLVILVQGTKKGPGREEKRVFPHQKSTKRRIGSFKYPQMSLSISDNKSLQEGSHMTEREKDLMVKKMEKALSSLYGVGESRELDY